MSKKHMTGILIMVLISLVALLVISCEMEIESNPTGRIIGKAAFTNTGTHDGIVVSLERLDRGLAQSVSRASAGDTTNQSSRVLLDQTTTDTTGEYSFDSVAEGFYTIYATSKDSKEQAVFASLQVAEGKTVTAPDLLLTAVGHIQGRVVLDDTETGNIGCIVFIAGTSYMAITDDAGNFTISSVPSGTSYEIVIMRGADTYRWTQNVEVEAESTTDLGSIELYSDDFPGTISIIWKGESVSAPTDPQVNWAYYNSVEGKSYIYDGTSWNVLAENGTSVVWVAYDGNQEESGHVPGIEFLYLGDPITVQDNIGNLTRTGYTFSGWNTQADGEGTDYAIGSSYVVEASLTLYATWTANTYTVAFDSHGATTNPANLSVTFGQHYGTLPSVERAGYTFGGWYTGTDGNGDAIFDTTTVSITANQTLHAKWTANTYEVAFDSQGGTTDPASISVTFDQQYGTLPSVERIGYTFDGWYTGAAGTGDLVLSGTTVTRSSNHTLYATWTANRYAVTLDVQGGFGGSDSITATYGSPMPFATAPSQAHYKFAGYFDAKDGTGTQYYTSTMESVRNWNKAEAARLYAKWEPYQIGDRGPAGGYIFYDDAVGYDADNSGTIDPDEWDFLDDNHDYVLNGDRYLEAAPSDFRVGDSDPNYIFGYYRPEGTNLVVGTGTGVGWGQYNTTRLASNWLRDDIYTTMDGDTKTTNYAATVAEDYVEGEYDDWFLPSKDELILMYHNLKQSGLGEFVNEIYWSSSEDNEIYAWHKYFGNGNEFNGPRWKWYRVRPVRAF